MQDTEEQYSIDSEISFPKNIRFHQSLTSGEKLFLAEIRAISKKNKDHRCHFSSRTMAKHFDVSHQTILNWVKNLKALELIEIGIDYKDKKQFYFIKPKI